MVFRASIREPSLWSLFILVNHPLQPLFLLDPALQLLFLLADRALQLTVVSWSSTSSFPKVVVGMIQEATPEAVFEKLGILAFCGSSFQKRVSVDKICALQWVWSLVHHVHPLATIPIIDCRMNNITYYQIWKKYTKDSEAGPPSESSKGADTFHLWVALACVTMASRPLSPTWPAAGDVATGENMIDYYLGMVPSVAC